ncbi:hypothetical protein N9D31_03040, partial [Oligoflexaceae bacterium]|nr:hypothetical protein [Oligoflexaceae bacterium]
SKVIESKTCTNEYGHNPYECGTATYKFVVPIFFEMHENQTLEGIHVNPTRARHAIYIDGLMSEKPDLSTRAKLTKYYVAIQYVESLRNFPDAKLPNKILLTIMLQPQGSILGTTFSSMGQAEINFKSKSVKMTAYNDYPDFVKKDTNAVSEIVDNLDNIELTKVYVARQGRSLGLETKIEVSNARMDDEQCIVDLGFKTRMPSNFYPLFYQLNNEAGINSNSFHPYGEIFYFGEYTKHKPVDINFTISTELSSHYTPGQFGARWFWMVDSSPSYALVAGPEAKEKEYCKAEKYRAAFVPRVIIELE